MAAKARAARISVAEAIARVRSARGPYALSNRDFVAWLHEEAA